MLMEENFMKLLNKMTGNEFYFRSCENWIRTENRVDKCPKCSGKDVVNNSFITCDCGTTVYIEHNANKCENCGKQYDNFGEKLIVKITENMVTDFNETLKNLNCIFRLKFNREDESYLGYSEYNPSCAIVPASKTFVSSAIINPTRDFYKILENFFKEREIEITYNNDGSIFWSKNGWRKI